MQDSALESYCLRRVDKRLKQNRENTTAISLPKWRHMPRGMPSGPAALRPTVARMASASWHIVGSSCPGIRLPGILSISAVLNELLGRDF